MGYESDVVSDGPDRRGRAAMTARFWCPFHNRLTGPNHECWSIYDWPTPAPRAVNHDVD